VNIPLFQGALWDHLIKHHSKKLILVLHAEDLRDMGANISRSLSWEKTVSDFVLGLDQSKVLQNIKSLENVIIRFDLEGAIYYSCNKNLNYISIQIYLKGNFGIAINLVR